ncbi:MAG: O-antigen ligase family protein [Cetobacterium sp.]
MFEKIKAKIDFDKIVCFLGILYLFFLFRRGGDSKYKLAVIMILVSIIYGYKNKFETVRKYFLIYIFGGLYLLSLGIVFYITVDKSNGRVEDFLGMSLYSVVYFLAVINIKLEENVYIRLIPIISLFSLESLYRGLKTVNLHRKWLGSAWYRLGGRTYPTIYAAELGIVIILGISGIYMYRLKKVKIFYLIYTFLFLVLLYFTKSRNSMLMIPITFCILSILKYKKKSIVMLLIILFSLGMVIKISPKFSGLKRMQTVSSFEKLKQDPRYEIFGKGIKNGKENILVGEGFYFYKKKGLSTTKAGLQPHYHNIFIETFATQGVITLIFYMLFLYSIIFYAIKNYYEEKGTKIKNIKLVSIGVSIFILLYGLSESVFYFTKIYMMLFTFLAINFISIKKLESN